MTCGGSMRWPTPMQSMSPPKKKPKWLASLGSRFGGEGVRVLGILGNPIASKILLVSDA